jgi:Eukaryotic aspartyl protease
VLLDSGNSFSYLPDEIVLPILSGVGAIQLEAGNWFVPCSLADHDVVFKFRLGNTAGPVVAVNISEFVVTPHDALFQPLGSSNLTFPDGEKLCLWGLRPSSTFGISVLGDTILRSAYVVFHQDASALAVAQAVFDTNESNVVQISGTDIPGATSTATEAPLTTKETYTSTIPPSTVTPSSPPSPTFDLGTPVTTSPLPSATQQGAAGRFAAPSVSIIGTIMMGVFASIGMLDWPTIAFM